MLLLNDVTRSVFSAGFDCGWEASLKQDAFHKLGARLSELLDEDQWAECEALLLSAGVTPNAQVTGAAPTGDSKSDER